MRRKLLIAAAVVILVALIGANRLIVAAVEERLDTGFRETLEASDLPFQIDYDELRVGATMTSFYLEGLTVLGPDESFVLICGIARFDIPISQLWKLRQADTPEELGAISMSGLSLGDVTMIVPREEASLLAGRLGFQLENAVAFGDLGGPPTLPTQPGGFQVWMEGLEIDAAPEAPPPIPQLYDQLSTIDDVSFAVHWDPAERRMAVDRFELNTPIASLDLSVFMDYVGDDADSLEWTDATSDFDFELSPGGIPLVDREEDVRFSLEHLKVAGSFSYDLDTGDDPFPVGTASVVVEGFSAGFEGNLREELQDSELAEITGLDFDKILVDRFSASYEIDPAMVQLRDMEIRTAHFLAQANGTVILDRPRREAPPMQAQLVISDLSPETEAVIQRLEDEGGRALPREGDDIVLNISGTLDEPRIEGFGPFPGSDVSGGPSIIVVPVGAPEDPDAPFIQDVSDQLANRLFGMLATEVHSLPMSDVYSGQLSEIARELDADLLLLVAAMQTGDRVRLMLDLAEAESETMLWSQTYDGGLGDLSDFLDHAEFEIVRSIVAGR